MTLAADEFIRRFLIHTQPPGFQRIRYFGFLANRFRKEKLDLCTSGTGRKPPDSRPAMPSFPVMSALPYRRADPNGHLSRLPLATPPAGYMMVTYFVSPTDPGSAFQAAPARSVSKLRVSTPNAPATSSRRHSARGYQPCLSATEPHQRRSPPSNPKITILPGHFAPSLAFKTHNPQPGSTLRFCSPAVASAGGTKRVLFSRHFPPPG